LVRIFQTAHEMAIEKVLLRGDVLFTIGADMKVGCLDVSTNADETKANFLLITRHAHSSPDFSIAASVNPQNTRMITVVKSSAKNTDLTPLRINATKPRAIDVVSESEFHILPNVESIMCAIEGAADWRNKSEEIFEQAMALKVGVDWSVFRVTADSK
jgi:hypothetical protein